MQGLAAAPSFSHPHTHIKPKMKWEPNMLDFIEFIGLKDRKTEGRGQGKGWGGSPHTPNLPEDCSERSREAGV